MDNNLCGISFKEFLEIKQIPANDPQIPALKELWDRAVRRENQVIIMGYKIER